MENTRTSGSSRSTLSRQDRSLRDEIARAIHARWCLGSPCVAENDRRCEGYADAETLDAIMAAIIRHREARS